VEGSKLCLFSVIVPAKYVSGVSPNFTIGVSLSASSL
jgi:hypothetical protein